jgi:hypothetical protein
MSDGLMPCRLSQAAHAPHAPNDEKGGYRQRLLLLAGVSAYVVTFQWMYENYLNPMWDYSGFHFNPPAAGYLALAWILSVLPAFWMPMKLTRPSQLAYWVLYITVFLPSMFVPLYVNLNSPAEISVLMLTLFAGLGICGASYWLPLYPLRAARILPAFFWKGFACIAAALVLLILVVYRHHLQIVSFMDAYDLRDAANDVAEGGLVSFAFMQLTGAINPLLMAYGLFWRRKWLFLAGALGQLLIYSVGATKGSLLSIVFLAGFYFLLRVGRAPFGLKITFATLALVGGLCLSYVCTDYAPGPLLFLALFVVLMRTFSANALMTAWYYDFFRTNPHTLYSHIRGVSWLVHYPYQRTVALEIGLNYIGLNDSDPTAHFWAIDGIGGLGLPGILLISGFCALVFWVLDSAASRHDPRLAALITCYAAYNIVNVSIFTSLFSGGLAFLILALYLLPREAVAHSGQGKYGFDRVIPAIVPAP